MGFEFLAHDLNKPPVKQEKEQQKSGKEYKEIKKISIGENGEKIITLKNNENNNEQELKQKVLDLKDEFKKIDEIKDSNEKAKKIEEISVLLEKIENQSYNPEEEKKVDASIVIEKEVSKDDENNSEILAQIEEQSYNPEEKYKENRNSSLAEAFIKKDSIVDNLDINISDDKSSNESNNKLSSVNINTSTVFDRQKIDEENNITLKYPKEEEHYNVKDEKKIKYYNEVKDNFNETPENLGKLFSYTVSKKLDDLEKKGEIETMDRALADYLIMILEVDKVFLGDRVNKKILTGNKADQEKSIGKILYKKLEEKSKEGVDAEYIKKIYENSGVIAAVATALVDWENVRKGKVNFEVSDNINIGVGGDGKIAANFQFKKTWGNEREKELEKVKKLKKKTKKAILMYNKRRKKNLFDK